LAVSIGVPKHSISVRALSLLSGETGLKISFAGLFAKAIFLLACTETTQGMKICYKHKAHNTREIKNQFAMFKRTIRAVKGSFPVLAVAALLNSCNLKTQNGAIVAENFVFMALAAETPDQGAKTIDILWNVKDIPLSVGQNI
jgi:hypothetical protein